MTHESTDFMEWATSEYGQCQLGDRRRIDRLIQIATQVAMTPNGIVSQVFADKASLQAAYDFVEHDGFLFADIAEAQHRATAQRCQGLDMVFIATDGVTISLPNTKKKKGFGRTGKGKARGLQGHTALAISAQGTPMGLSGLHLWSRGPKPKVHHHQRELKDKESLVWLVVRKQARKVFEEEAAGVTRWFQHDRGSDAWPVHLDAFEHRDNEYTTIRASWNRRLVTEQPESAESHLWQELEKQSLRGRYSLDVSGSRKRKARQGVFAVRACEVTLRLTEKLSRQEHHVPVWAVHVLEDGTTPEGEKPIEWMLLTSHPVHTFEDACLVVWGYSQRWKIEVFHNTWKSGSCQVESCQLEEPEHVMKWATILAGEAARQYRLTLLSREHPELPALEEFSPHELEALLDLTDTEEPSPESLTLAVVMMQIAELGGYPGKHCGYSPGARVIARGLKKLAPVARAYFNRSKRKRSSPSGKSRN